jgi:hypothetical protein
LWHRGGVHGVGVLFAFGGCMRGVAVLDHRRVNYTRYIKIQVMVNPEVNPTYQSIE